MIRSTARLLITLAVAAAPVALAVPAQATPVVMPQTITFTSTPPTDAIFDRIDGLGGYAPTAVSTSHRVVQLSVDTSNHVCFATPGVIGDPDSAAQGRITIFWNAPGTCTVYADQAGDSQYLPAKRVVQKFEVHREISHLSAAKVSKGALGLTSSVFRATLTQEYRFGPGVGSGPVAGAPVVFAVGGKKVCTGVTDENGLATCKARIGIKNALIRSGYTASYAGAQYVAPTAATGKLG